MVLLFQSKQQNRLGILQQHVNLQKKVKSNEKMSYWKTLTCLDKTIS